MALSFFYIAFIRVLELLQLRGNDTTELAIEVVTLLTRLRSFAGRSGACASTG
jgi:hypothetical protein